MGLQKSDGDSRSLLSSLGEFWAMRMAIGCSIRGGVYYLLERYFSLDDLFISYLFLLTYPIFSEPHIRSYSNFIF